MIRPAVMFAFSLFASIVLAGQPVGWRTDGTGQYPAADPPTSWSATENVVWKTPMPNWSNASPCVVADRIFVNAEPNVLICVSKADGKILWQQSHGYDQVMTEADKQEAAAANAKVEEIRKTELAPLNQQRNEINKKMQPLAKKVKDKTATDDDNKQIADLRAQAGEVQKKMAAVEAKIAPLLKWESPPAEGSNGHTSFTPVSDGQVVVALFNNGVVVCYDMAGQRKWIGRIDERCPNNWGACASPVIVDGKVIVQIKTMFALNLSDGKHAWKCEQAEWKWGTPFVTKIGQTDVIITANGDIVRASDGKRLAGPFCKLVYNSPIVHDGVAYFVQHGGAAVQLSAKDGGEAEGKQLWKTTPKSDRYYASPVLVDGLLYGITQRNIISAIDAKTGEVVAEKDLALGKMTVYPSLAFAGKYLFVSNEDGTTAVMQPGKEFKEIGRCSLERFRSTPVFEGSRVYIRGYQNLYCIGK